METNGNFYLGRLHDVEKDKTTEKPLLYDPDDLTTHAVVVGMTGSGKTGLCIDLLEEAALNGIPALMIDPKGDITNALLHFPDLLPTDFQPWVNADQARREGLSPEDAAEQAASLWRKGLGDWGIEGERIQALKDAAHFAVYTPGSNTGIPVDIMASLKAPGIAWEDNQELLRDRIVDTVTALLGLVGMQGIDPVRSREHILLANIFERAWSQGKDLELSELILQTQKPPFAKLGVMDLEQFFPEKERFDLSMLLNNILAAPSFQAWIEGQPLDVPSLLYGPDGRPRHSVFYIAHLNDQERMFFVTLLYAAVETWMRGQAGSSSLRALMYFDEIHGYLPPVAVPPSKPIMLRMLKQGRAFGLGQLLATQNPVDVDYKALSNAGTWFIGKLQTDQDKQRLLDGLEGAAAGSMERKTYDRLISRLGKRVFLLHNVHEKQPQVFYTRWAMNYLTGPLTRNQIPALNELAGATVLASAATASTPAARETESPAQFSTTRPAVPSGVAEYFLPNNLTLSEAAKASGSSLPAEAADKGLLYRPVLIAQADIRLLQRKYDLDHQFKRTALVSQPDRRGVVRWEDHLNEAIDPRDLEDAPAPKAQFAALEAPLSDAKLFKALEKDFLDWAYRTTEVHVWANEALKLYGAPAIGKGQFLQTCAEAASKERDDEVKKLKAKYKTRIDAVQKKLAREKRELSEDQTKLSQRKMEEMGTHLENVISLFGGRSRRLTTSLTKRRMTSQAKADVEESLEVIEELEHDLVELGEEIESAIDEVEARWDEVAGQVEQIPVTPYKKDILVELFGVAWMPYYLVEMGEKQVEIPGFFNKSQHTSTA